MTDPDGAADKLFHDESSASLKDHVEVKFVSPDSAKNGDAKINIGDLKSSFAGMGKMNDSINDSSLPANTNSG